MFLSECVSVPQLGDDVAAMFKDKIQNFKTLTPMIVELGNPSMRPRHWAKVYKELGRVCCHTRAPCVP